MNTFPANLDREQPVTGSILWRGILLPGHEACRMLSRQGHWNLDGVAAFSYEKMPCQLSYHITCDASWRTLSASVGGWVGDREIKIALRAQADQRWWLNDVEIPEVSGCIDLDLNFSPSTNTIAINRLQLAPGEKKEIRAAWLRFPGFTLEPLAQSYQRLQDNLYRYESAGGSFVADLAINRMGFVTDYPGIWQAETTSGR